MSIQYAPDSVPAAISQYIRQHALLRDGMRLVIAFSGGVDSVALVTYLVQQREFAALDIHLVHIDHGWRVESADDAAWCVSFGTALGVTAVVNHLNDAMLRDRGSPEDTARHARYQLLDAYAEKIGADAIVLAHHADDQIETFLMRLIRGAGLDGLIGMKPEDVSPGGNRLIRPLLCCNKEQLIHLVTISGYTFRTDSSNTDLRYLRNRIRHILIPAFAKTDPRGAQQILTSMRHLHAVQDYIKSVTAVAESAVFTITKTDSGIERMRMNRYVFAQQHPTIQHQLLLQWLKKERVSFIPREAFFKELIKLLDPEHTTRVIPFEGWALRLKTNSDERAAWIIQT